MKKPPLMPQRRLLSCESQKGHAKPHAERRVATSERRPYPAVLPKFRNPDDPSQTWTGRGKQPRWLTAKLRSGKMVDEFRI
jgi:DNA-binding protein H-NS